MFASFRSQFVINSPLNHLAIRKQRNEDVIRGCLTVFCYMANLRRGHGGEGIQSSQPEFWVGSLCRGGIRMTVRGNTTLRQAHRKLLHVMLTLASACHTEIPLSSWFSRLSVFGECGKNYV